MDTHNNYLHPIFLSSSHHQNLQFSVHLVTKRHLTHPVRVLLESLDTHKFLCPIFSLGCHNQNLQFSVHLVTKQHSRHVLCVHLECSDIHIHNYEHEHEHEHERPIFLLCCLEIHLQFFVQVEIKVVTKRHSIHHLCVLLECSDTHKFMCPIFLFYGQHQNLQFSVHLATK